MDQSRPTVIEVIIKTIVTHTITYFIMGLLASVIFDYGRLYAKTNLNLLMRQTSELLVMAGPLFQPIRGILFGIVFFLLRDILFGRKNGWLVMWIVLVVVGIISPFGPTPGSIEGMIYTIVPIGIQMKGIPEVLLQAFILSVVLFNCFTHFGVDRLVSALSCIRSAAQPWSFYCLRKSSVGRWENSIDSYRDKIQL